MQRIAMKVDKFKFLVSEVIENPDDSATVFLDFSNEFVEWFKKDQDLKRWSQKRFEKWFNKALKQGLGLTEER